MNRGKRTRIGFIPLADATALIVARRYPTLANSSCAAAAIASRVPLAPARRPALVTIVAAQLPSCYSTTVEINMR